MCFNLKEKKGKRKGKRQEEERKWERKRKKKRGKGRRKGRRGKGPKNLSEVCTKVLVDKTSDFVYKILHLQK